MTHNLSFTTESLIAMALVNKVAPPALALLQLGFDPDDDSANENFLRLVDRGSRNLGVLHDAIDPSDEVKEQLRRIVIAMSSADTFVALRRSDQLGSRVLYCGETVVVDSIDELGNHRLQDHTAGVSGELQDLLGECSVSEGSSVVCSAERLEPDAEARPGEDPRTESLVSADAVDYLASIGCPARANVQILRWRSVARLVFKVEESEGQVIFTPTTTEDAAASLLSTLEAVQATSESVQEGS